jgi:CheY-like chemotaxis protein
VNLLCQEFDLVIADMTMAGITGDKLAQKLMGSHSDIPVILCTGGSEHISEEKAKIFVSEAIAKLKKRYHPRVVKGNL